MKERSRFRLLSGFLLLIIGTMGGIAPLKDGLHFVTGIDKSYISNTTDTVTHADLWLMHNGVGKLVATVTGLYILLPAFWSALTKKKQKN